MVKNVRHDDMAKIIINFMSFFDHRTPISRDDAIKYEITNIYKIGDYPSFDNAISDVDDTCRIDIGQNKTSKTIVSSSNKYDFISSGILTLEGYDDQKF